MSSMRRLHHGVSAVLLLLLLLLLLLAAMTSGVIGPTTTAAAAATTGLVGHGGSAAVLGQLQHGPVALAAGGTVEAVGPVVVDPLVVAEVPGQTEGFPTQVAHVALLTVDSHVVAQRHVVGVGLAAEVAPEVSSLVGELVVQQGAGVLVGTGAHVADVRPLV